MLTICKHELALGISVMAVMFIACGWSLGFAHAKDSVFLKQAETRNLPEFNKRGN